MYTYFPPVKIDNCVIIFKYINRIYRDKENTSDKKDIPVIQRCQKKWKVSVKIRAKFNK